MFKNVFKILLFVLILPLIPCTLPLCYAQSTMYNHPEMKWQIIETRHFKIFADTNLLSVAKDIGKIAEEVFPSVTEDLGWKPDFKVPIELIDYDEEFNGSAEPIFGKMVIYCSSGTKMTSGNLPWLRRVIAHEFSHVVTFGAIGAFDSFGQRYQTLGALQIIPIWFLEGVAQYEAETWDTHRDMLLRMATLENILLPFSMLDGFAGTDVRESRLVYEEGHSLIRYMVSVYGNTIIKDILEETRKNPVNFIGAFKKMTKQDPPEVYEKWKSFTKNKYVEMKNKTQPYYDFAMRLTNRGGWMWHPVFSPDGKRVLFASSFEYDYAICDLYTADFKDNKLTNIRKIVSRASFFHSFSPDGKKILFSKISNEFKKEGSYIEDLYICDADGKNQKRITFAERAKHPSFSPDGKTIAYVVNKLGVTDIWIMKADGSGKMNLTRGIDYEQNDSPRWSGDSRYIAFSRFAGRIRSIAVFDMAKMRMQVLTNDEFDNRTPVFLPGSKTLLFTSDRINRIPNLFLMEIKENAQTGFFDVISTAQLTNVTGGVFEPEVNPDGTKAMFSGFSGKGFDLYLMDLPRAEKNKIAREISRNTEAAYRDLLLDSGKDSVSFSVSKAYSYNSFMGIRPIFFIPAITISNYGLWGTVGTYFLDPLEKHTIQAYGYFDGYDAVYSVNYTNRQLYPTLVFSVYENPYYLETSSTYRKFRGTSIEAFFPLTANLTVSALAGFNVSQKATFETDKYVVGQETNENNLGAGIFYTTYRERVDSDFNPAGGRNISLTYVLSSPLIGSVYDYNLYRFDWREYIDVWRRGGHTLAFRLFGRAVFSDAGYTISIPWDDNTLRGVPWGTLTGSRNMSSSLEYRFPLVKNIGFNFLGFYFDRFFLVPFIDYGAAWYNNDMSTWKARSSAGVETRLRFWVMSRYPMILRIGVLQELKEDKGTGWLFSIQPNF